MNKSRRTIWPLQEFDLSSCKFGLIISNNATDRDTYPAFQHFCPADIDFELMQILRKNKPSNFIAAILCTYGTRIHRFSRRALQSSRKDKGSGDQAVGQTSVNKGKLSWQILSRPETGVQQGQLAIPLHTAIREDSASM